MKQQYKQKREEGFTIIEVLIVLAIAALILVVVLVAIPQLQRNQRNSARQNDASRVVTSVQNWSANNNGRVFPGDSGSISSVANDLGDLAQYDDLTTNLTHATGVQSALTDLNQLRIVTRATCGNDGVTVAGSGVGTRAVAVQFAVETAGDNEGRCVSS